MAGIGLSLHDPALVGQGGTVTPVTIAPAAISGLYTWLDAAAGVLDASAAPISVDGTAVETWTDQAGTGLTPTAGATLARRPLWKENVINGQPVIRFNGTSNYLGINGTAKSIPQTMVAVLKVNAFGANRAILSGDAFRNWNLDQQSGNFIIYVNSGSYGHMLSLSGDWIIVAWTFNNLASRWAINSTTFATAAAAVGTNDISGIFFPSHNPSYMAAVDLAEYVWYDGAVAESDLQGLIQWLAAKYAITINTPWPWGIVANDDFESYNVNDAINGLSGGSGWNGNWVAR